MSTLTPRETEALIALYKNEYHSGDAPPCVWAFTVADNSPIPRSSVPGVVGSLSRKGVVSCDGEGDDAMITVTDGGHALAISLGIADLV